MKHKIKKVDAFKENEKWFLPPEHIQTIKNTVEAALKNAQYSVNPTEYSQDMGSKLDAVLELEKIDNDCICGIKFNGKVLYMPSKSLKLQNT